MEYLSRQLKPDTWEVSKWGDDTRPLEVYTLVDRGKRGWRCSSPGCQRTTSCKHVAVVIQRKALPPHDMPFAMFDAR